MSATSSQIQLQARPFPRVTAAQAGVLAALLVVALAGGLVLGRANSTVLTPADITPAGITPSRFAAAESVISTQWLATTPAYRQAIMDEMNSLPSGTSEFVGTADTPLNVMQHMNALAAPDSAIRFHRSAVGVRVARPADARPTYPIERYKG